MLFRIAEPKPIASHKNIPRIISLFFVCSCIIFPYYWVFTNSKYEPTKKGFFRLVIVHLKTSWPVALSPRCSSSLSACFFVWNQFVIITSNVVSYLVTIPDNRHLTLQFLYQPHRLKARGENWGYV